MFRGVFYGVFLLVFMILVLCGCSKLCFPRLANYQCDFEQGSSGLSFNSALFCLYSF